MTGIDAPAAPAAAPAAASTSAAPASGESMPAETSNGAVTEAEAALYDRQIRLWGVEAQGRLRTSHVMLAGLNGVATEAAKNLVLAGVGSLSVLDAESVTPGDLAAGFFFRDDDVGSSRVAPSVVSRIQALNPLVAVHALTDTTLLSGDATTVAARLKERHVDALVVCSGTRAYLESLNDAARLAGARFYLARSAGLGGALFADLGPAHEYVTERATAAGAEKRRVLNRQTFVPLRESVRADWSNTPPRTLRRLRLSPGLFGLWALWDAEESQSPFTTALEDNIKRRGVLPEQVFTGLDRDAWTRAFQDATVNVPAGEFAPTCAVLGGLLAQDVLNALGGREEPIVNWLVLDALGSGVATVHAVGDGLERHVGIGA